MTTPTQLTPEQAAGIADACLIGNPAGDIPGHAVRQRDAKTGEPLEELKTEAEVQPVVAVLDPTPDENNY